MSAESNRPEGTESGGGGGPLVVIILGVAVVAAAIVLAVAVKTQDVPAEAANGDASVAAGDVQPTAMAAEDDAGADSDSDTSEQAPKQAEGSGKSGADQPAAKVAPAKAEDQKMVELPLELPNPVFSGTPKDVPPGARMEKLTGKARPPIMIPADLNLEIVSRGKPVTSSDPYPIIGDLTMVTDGDKEALDGRFVELAPGLQWIQIDLEQQYDIWAIFVWHNHMDARVYRDVIVQLSNDPDFLEGVKTVYNNDYDNSAGMGVGEHYEYFEYFDGRYVPVKDVEGQYRYVRCYTNGSTLDDMNHYNEVEVWAKAE